MDAKRNLSQKAAPDKIVVRLEIHMTLIIRQSRIHSFGCYTTRPIRKGALIIEYVGEPMSYEQADDLYDDFENTYLFGLDGGKKIIDGYGWPVSSTIAASQIARRSDPGKMWIIALRDIPREKN